MSTRQCGGHALDHPELGRKSRETNEAVPAHRFQHAQRVGVDRVKAAVELGRRKRGTPRDLWHGSLATDRKLGGRDAPAVAIAPLDGRVVADMINAHVSRNPREIASVVKIELAFGAHAVLSRLRGSMFRRRWQGSNTHDGARSAQS